jgi:1-acyl-sn-glycerol-3-phosphate acyltransferase
MSSGPKFEHYVFGTLALWAKKLCRICQVKLEVFGREHMNQKRTYLFVVNHQSPADILALYASMPVHASFVSTDIMKQIPVFSYWMRVSGAVFVHQGDRKGEMTSFRSMVQRLEHGRSLILFPEGYMHQGEGLAEFRRGGIYSALIARVPIVPVYLGGTSEVMRTGTLYIEPRRRVVVEFGDPIETEGLDFKSKKNMEVLLREQISTMKEKYESTLS